MSYCRLYTKLSVPPRMLSMYLALLHRIGDKDPFGVVHGLDVAEAAGGAVYGSNFSLSIFHNDYK